MLARRRHQHLEGVTWRPPPAGGLPGLRAYPQAERAAAAALERCKTPLRLLKHCCGLAFHACRMLPIFASHL